MRIAHILQPLVKGLSPLQVYFFDIETTTCEETDKKLKQEFKIGYSWYVKFDKRARVKMDYPILIPSKSFLLESVTSRVIKRKTLYVLSCNIWFDIRVSDLFTSMVNSGWKVSIFHNSGVCVIIKLKYREYTILFLNISQFIRGSVKDMGKMVGKPKLECDFGTATLDELITYCRRDTEIIRDAFVGWVQFISNNKLGKLGYTIASQAFIAYKTRFMSQEIFIHGNDKATEFERWAYFGGRTEIFFQGRMPYVKYYYLDVNSMYPYIMCNYKLPYKLIGYEDEISVPEFAEYMEKYYCIAQVSISTKVPYYPLRQGSKVIYPVGRFTTTLCHGELKLALENGHIQGVWNLIYYESAVLFKDYVDFFYGKKTEYKKTGNTIYYEISKRIQNSLYGKFGQRSDVLLLEEYVEEADFSMELCFNSGDNRNYKEVTVGHVRRSYRENDQEAQHSFPAISAGVTSYARCLLLLYIRQAGFQNCFYCDTDSIITNRVGYNRLKEHIDPVKLGMLGLEKTSRHFIINCPKDYVFGGTTTIKGINKTAKRIKQNSWDTLEFPSLKSDMQNGLDEHYSINKKNKTLSRNYTKGTVLKNGKVVPLKFKEW